MNKPINKREGPLTLAEVPGAPAGDLLKLSFEELDALIAQAECLTECALNLTRWLQGITTEKRLRRDHPLASNAQDVGDCS